MAMTRRNRRLAIAITCITAAGAIVGVAWRSTASRYAKFDAALEKWSALGGKTSFVELQPPAIPDKVNAARVYEQAFAILASVSESEREVLSAGTDIDAMRPIVETMREAIDFAIHAGEFEQCNWNVEYSLLIEALLPHLWGSVSLARLLRAEAKVAAASGDMDRVETAVLAGLHLSRAITTDRMLICLAVGTAVESLTLDAMEDCGGSLSPEQLQHIGDVLRSRDYSAAIRGALLGEGALGLSCIDSIVMGKQLNTSSFSWNRRADKLFFVEKFTRAVELASEPYHAVHEQIVPGSPPRRALASTILMPVWDRSIERGAQIETRRLLCMGAIALRLHFLDNGSYPDSWDTPVDPLTGKPLGYERTETGFRLWSPAIEDETDPKKRAQLEWRWDG